MGLFRVYAGLKESNRSFKVSKGLGLRSKERWALGLGDSHES